VNAVVAKDLRLASDALRPLAIIVGGVMLAVIAVSFVPPSVAPSLLGASQPSSLRRRRRVRVLDGSQRADPNVVRGLRDAAFMRRLPIAGDQEFVAMVEGTSVAIKPTGRDNEHLFRAAATFREVERRVSLMSDTEFAGIALARAVVNAARSGGPNAPRMRNALMFPEDRGLRFALEFANEPQRRESGLGYMAAWRLASGDPVKVRALQQRFESHEASQRFIIDQLEAAAAEGHPLAKELREAAANLRARLAPPSDPEGDRP